MCNRKIIFLFLNQNICCGYSKEVSQWDGSFEHPKHILKIMGKKIFTLLRWKVLFIYTCVSFTDTIVRPVSAVGNTSYCRSRGRVFDHGPVPYFRGDWSWNMFYGHSPPSTDSRRFFVSYKRKYVHKIRVNCLVKLTHEKVRLGGLTGSTWP